MKLEREGNTFALWIESYKLYLFGVLDTIFWFCLLFYPFAHFTPDQQTHSSRQSEILFPDLFSCLLSQPAWKHSSHSGLVTNTPLFYDANKHFDQRFSSLTPWIHVRESEIGPQYLDECVAVHFFSGGKIDSFCQIFKRGLEENKKVKKICLHSYFFYCKIS